jgi:hypothetical protein
MDVVAILLAGRALLDPVLTPHGFRFTSVDTGVGSGGRFARGAYVRGDRRLALSFRYSLGDVVYHAAGVVLAHEDYMREKLGRVGGNAYPGFPADPRDGFRHLAHDLAHFCGEFLSGSDAEFRALAARAEVASQPRGFRALP